MHQINWISTAIGLVSIVLLYIAKSLNDRFKAKIRVILPCELILVGNRCHCVLLSDAIV